MIKSMSSGFRGLLAAAALGLMGTTPGGIGLGTPSAMVAPAARPGAKQRRYGDGALAAASSYRRGPGWSYAQVKRMAKKRKNVKANRRNHQG